MRSSYISAVIYSLSYFLSLSQGAGLPGCVINPCNNGGTCIILGDMYECRCPPGFGGRICDNALAKPTTTTTTPKPTTTTTPKPTTTTTTTPKPTTTTTTPKPTTTTTTPKPTTTTTTPKPTTTTTPKPTTTTTTPKPTTTTTTPKPTTTTTPKPTTITTTPKPTTTTTPKPTTTTTTPRPTTTTTTPKPTTTTTPKPTTTTTTPKPTTTPLDLCARFNPCLNGGICHHGGGPGFSCDCAPGFTGIVCDQAVTTPAPTTQAPTTQAPTTQAPTTQAPTTTTPKPTTPAPTTPALTITETLGRAGCRESEIVFMVEHMRGDTRNDVDHEADFIRNLVKGWPIDDDGVRVGVLTYDREIKEHIHLDDYSGDKKALIDKLENLASQVGSTGNANLAEVLEYARRNMYKDPRRHADKIAVAIVHQMSNDAKREFAREAQNLRAQGITLYALAVEARDDVKQLLQAHADHYHEFDSFDDLEHQAPNNFSPNC